MAFKRPPTHRVNCHSTIVEAHCKPLRPFVKIKRPNPQKICIFLQTFWAAVHNCSNCHVLNQNGLSTVMNIAGVRWLSDRPIRGCTNLMYRHGTRKHCVALWRKENSSMVVHVLSCSCRLFLEINFFWGKRTEVERIKLIHAAGSPPRHCCWVIYRNNGMTNPSHFVWNWNHSSF